MTGGGLFRVRGVFMTPNAGPFIISGGASLNLTNAQYVTSSIELNGSGTNITMISTSEIRISVVTRADQLIEAVRVVHSAFELDGDQEAVVHAGTGR